MWLAVGQSNSSNIQAARHQLLVALPNTTKTEPASKLEVGMVIFLD
jgi:hypothetical protein